MLNLAIFVSGRGSNLKAILDSSACNEGKYCVKVVISDKERCGAFDIAHSCGIPTYSISKITRQDFISHEELPSILQKLNINLIVLAGYLKKIPDEICSLYQNKMINIHPALLPSFGGKGMYGMNVHKAVFESSAKVSGATVHFVNEIYDSGAIIMQKCVDITDVENPEEIAAKVLKIEHEILPSAILKLAENKVKIKNKRIYLID